MAWKVESRKNKYCVINTDTGKTAKCFTSITQAEQFRKAQGMSKATVSSQVSALKKKASAKYGRRK